MSNSTLLIRSLLIYGIVIPLAIFLGWLLGNANVEFSYQLFSPSNREAQVVIGLVFTLLILPLLLRWHHLFLFLSWNTPALVFFLPGSPEFWIFMAMTSFTITITHRALDSNIRMFPVPSVIWPLLFILVVVVGTAELNNGIHLNSFGGSDFIGGKRYILIIAAVFGFIAMTSHNIPMEKATLYAGGFLLGNLTNLIPILAPYLYSTIPLLFQVFPIDTNTYGAITQESNGESVSRNYGLSISLCWAFLYMLARYGIKNLLRSGNFRKSVLTALFFVGGMAGGFRSFLLMMLITAFFLFWIEGLFRSRYTVVLLAALACLMLLLPFAKSLPRPIQRAISVLPLVEVDPAIQREAEGSSEWRLRIWRAVLPEVPKYFWLGKGLGINASEYWAEVGMAQNGSGEDAATFLMSGDYHNGPLSVIIPFGIWGMAGWLWFLAAAVRVFVLNHRNSPPALQTINTFLLANFLTRIVLFFFCGGGFGTDLCLFTGLVGLSICLNGGIRKQIPVPVRVVKRAQKKLPLQTRLARSC